MIFPQFSDIIEGEYYSKEINKVKKLISILLIATTLVCLGACAVKDKDNLTPVEGATNYVKLEMESGDVMIIELYPDAAPITVNNFKKLVANHYYDGTIFHRVIEGFMIQGGAGAETDAIKGEFSSNGVKNDIQHDRGVLSMARTSDPNSATSQFFICQSREGCQHLDGNYAAFGKVISGLDVIDKIASVDTNANDKPLTEQKIKSITFIELSSSVESETN